MKRIFFIDGSNLYGGLTDLLRPGEYIDFSDFLTVIEEDLSVDAVQFYATYMKVDPDKPSAYRLVLEAQKKFFDGAKNNPKVTFSKGHFSGFGKEKGVDVMLAVDLAVGAATNKFDEAVIMTGDADLRYAVEVAQKFEKPIHLAAIGSRFPFGIVRHVENKFVYDLGIFFKDHAHYKPKGLVVRGLDQKVKVLSI
jgi:uncharacterized LabA/DUF88 family protein